VCEASVCHVQTRWSCLEKPPNVPTGSGSFTATFLVRDTVSQEPKVGLSARACRRLDVKCTDGISGATVTDATGHVSLVVPAGFNGYARFDDPTISSTLFFFDPPLYADRPSLTVSVNAPETAAIVAALAGVEPDSSLGVALVTVFDCFGKPAEGVRVKADDAGDAAEAFYIRDGLPSPAAVATDETGYAIFVNAAPGTATFSASIDDMRIGSVTVLVQAGAQTIAHVVPNGE
jgi:hypothetical protein